MCSHSSKKDWASSITLSTDLHGIQNGAECRTLLCRVWMRTSETTAVSVAQSNYSFLHRNASQFLQMPQLQQLQACQLGWWPSSQQESASTFQLKSWSSPFHIFLAMVLVAPPAGISLAILLFMSLPIFLPGFLAAGVRGLFNLHFLTWCDSWLQNFTHSVMRDDHDCCCSQLRCSNRGWPWSLLLWIARWIFQDQ